MLVDPVTDMKNCDGSNFGLTVYNATTGGSNSNYQIQWGDGSPDFNSGTFPGGGLTHTYTSAEIFDLYFIVTGANGCIDTAIYNIANITNPAIGAANPGGTTGCGPLTLCFPLNNFASNHPTTYYIVDFGDGSPQDTLPHPPPATLCHTYTASSCGSAGNAFMFSIMAVNQCDNSEATISPIRVFAGPQAGFNNPATACTGSPVTMTNTSVAGFNSSCSSSTIYNWDFGDGGTLTTVTLTHPVHTYAAPGTYTISLTTTNSCGSNTITHQICIENPPTPNFTLSPATGCVPFTTQITNLSGLTNTCNVTRNWTVIFNGSTCLPSSGNYQFTNGTNAGSANPSIEFLQPGSYTVRLTLTNSCGSFQFTQAVTAQAPPQVSINPLAAICAGASVTPSAVINHCYEPTDTYNWSFPGGSPTSSATLNPGAVTYANSGSYTISLAATNSCGTVNASVPLIVNPIPPPLNPMVNSPVCVGDDANFTSDVVPGVSYSWTGPSGPISTNPAFTIDPVNAGHAGTYTLTGSIGGCPGVPQTVSLVVQPLPVVSITPAAPVICAGDSVQLTASGASTFVWTPSATLSTAAGTSVMAGPSTTTVYTVTGTTGSCSGTANVTVTVNPLPVVNAGPDTILCNQPIAIQLNGTPSGGTWTGTNVTAGGSFTPSSGGSFPMVYSFTNANGCSNTDTLIVTVIAPTPANAGPDLTYCADAPNDTLTGLPAGGIWSGTGITSAGIFDPTIADTFDLVYTFGTGTCLTRDTMEVIVHPLPAVNAGLDFSLCADAPATTLTGSPTGGTWSGTGITAGGTFTPATAGAGNHTLTYSITDANGCSNTDQLIATIHPLPLVNTGNDTTLCNQPVAVQLTATPTGGTWSGADITAGGQFTPSGTGTVIVIYTVTDANGCTAADSLNVTVIDPTLADAGTDFDVCQDAANVTLTPNPAGGTWSGPGVTPAGIFDPTVAGTFELVYLVGVGSCQASDTLQAIVNPLPVVDAGANFSNCTDATAVTLNGTPTGGTWSGTGITDPNGTFTPATAGAGAHTLTYSYTDANGCSSSDVLTATVNPLPVVNAGPDTTLCNQPIPVTFTATPAGGTWSGMNVTTGGVFTPNGTGNFTLTYTFTNANGCVNSNSRIVTVNPPVMANAGADTAVCIDAANVVLSGTPLPGTWTGSGVTAGGMFDPTIDGTFDLVYTIGSGTCLTRDTLQAIVNPLPIVDAGNNFTYCADAANVLLNPNPLGGTWSGTGITDPNGVFSPPTAGAGTHTLTYNYTDANGCSASDVLTATINPLPIVSAGNDTTLCNQPIPTVFMGSPMGGTWSGTGINAIGVFTPTGTGTFTLAYIYTDGNGCVNLDSKVVTVVDPVQANAGSDFAVCIDAPNVVLNGTAAGGTWTGTDVTPAGVFNPTTAGTFNLVYSLGAGNCLTRDTLVAIVNPLPIVNAGPNLDFCPSDAIVNFTATPAGGTWSGAGIQNAATGEFNPAVPPVGSHQEIYTYTDPATGCLNRDTLLAIVHPTPVPNFTFNPVVCVGTAELFTNTSTFGNAYDWDFGDGGTATAQSPSHTYNTPGFFDIELIVTSAFGCMDSITQQIEVRIPPTADFALTPDSACAPVIVSFTNSSTGPALSFDWDFGNGQSSTAQDPGTQTYFQGVVADTTYTITLTVTNFCGTDTDIETVTAMPSPTAIFGTNTDIGCSPLELEFANNSLGLPDTYDWDFGDGTTSNTDDPLFTHQYTTGANDTTYTIELIVANECGADTAYHTITVLPNQVTAFFNTDAPSGCVPHTVNFTQFSSGGTFSSWDFGDGNVSTDPNPSHTFTDAGTYTVYLYVNDGCGYDTATVDITVFPSPNVAFSSEPDSVCIDVPFTFTNLSTGLASCSWDFGDGGSSTLFDPEHSYSATGVYNVTLTGVSQTNGCTASVTHPVVVSTNAVAAFTPNPVNGCMPLEVSFTNNSTNADFQSWDFGDGNFSTALNPTHTFTAAGSYTVRLYVENTNGCPDSAAQVVTVYPLPTADFDFVNTNSCYPPVTIATANNSTGAVNYEWDFGDGATSALTNPGHVYTTPGEYDIQLIASNIYGCSDTATMTLNVYQAPVAGFVLPEDTVCVGEAIVFNSTSTFADSVVWDFGDGNTYTGTTVEYAFPGSGTFPVTVMVYGDGGCGDTLTVNMPIVVNPTPVADFEFVNIQNPDPLSGTVEFTNTSTNSSSWYWDFGNGNSSEEMNPIERYNSFGEFDVMLIASNEFGCVDTTYQTIGVDFFYGLYIPNAISPGHTDFEVANFIPKGVGLASFELLIYDDWGNLIWQTSALDADGRPTEYWDGTYMGQPVQQDAYVWKASATFLNYRVWEGKEYGNKLKRSGTVTVIQ